LSEQPDYDVEECNFTLFTKTVPSTEYEIFVVEAYGAAILDTACTRTVCGQQWLNNYTSHMNSQDKKMTSVPSQKIFKFGDGKTVYSDKMVTTPARIGHTNCNIQTEVVPADIPLLLSKNSFKKAGTMLNLKEDRAVMFNEQIDLELTSSGHYCVNIINNDDDNSDVNCKEIPEQEVLIVNSTMDVNKKRQILHKFTQTVWPCHC